MNNCPYVKEYQTLNGWIYYCRVTAEALKLSQSDLEKVGCTDAQRKLCTQKMLLTLGMESVPDPS